MSYRRQLSSECDFDPTQTQQTYPTINDILVKFKRGEDLSDLVYNAADVPSMPAAQFSNRMFKVDPLTERQDYIKKQLTELEIKRRNVQRQQEQSKEEQKQSVTDNQSEETSTTSSVVSE